MAKVINGGYVMVLTYHLQKLMDHCVLAPRPPSRFLEASSAAQSHYVSGFLAIHGFESEACYVVSGVRYQEFGKKLTLVGDGGARDG